MKKYNLLLVWSLLLVILFSPSEVKANPAGPSTGSGNIYTNPDDNYRWNYKAGWKGEDLDIKQTTMKVRLQYTNAGYYKGKLIDATAEISITPSKNNNETSVNNSLRGGGYCGIYQP